MIRTQRRRRWVWRAMALLAIVAAAGWIASRVRPSWWRASPPDSTSRVVADQFEQGVVAEVQRVRESDSAWTVRLDEAQINEWLRSRLRAWVEYQDASAWPEGLMGVAVRCRPDALDVGVDMDAHVYSVSVRPAMAGGQLRVTVGRAWIGRLPLVGVNGAESIAAMIDPALLQQLRSDPEVGAWIGALLDGESIVPELELVDGRRVQVVDLELAEGSIFVKCITKNSKP